MFLDPRWFSQPIQYGSTHARHVSHLSLLFTLTCRIIFVRRSVPETKLLVVGLQPKTLATSARRSSLIWINAWQNWRKRIEDSEQARTSLDSPPLETNSLASRQNRYRPVRAESSRRGSRVWRADGRPLSKRCRPLVFHPTSKFHRQPPTLFPHPPHLPVLFPPSYLRFQPPTPSHQLFLSHHSRVRIFFRSSSPLTT